MKNQHGVTLVELLVVILIMTVISGVSIMLLNLSLTTESKVSIDNQLQREARFAMERVSETLLDGGTFNYEDNGDIEITNVSQSILYDASEKSLILNQGKFNEDLISQNIPHFKISENYGVYMKLELKNHTYEVSTKLTAGNSRIRN